MALWTPAKITTGLWLDAADSSTITLNGSSVSQWDDKSGNDRHATQGWATAQPELRTAEVNGLDAIRFDGVDDILTSTQSINIQSAQTFVVGQAISELPRLVLRRSSNQGRSRYYLAGAYTIGDSTVAASTVDLAIHCVRSLSGQQEAWTNGISQGTASDANTYTHNSFPIGGGTTPVPSYGNVDVCEVIHFDTPIDDATREKIEGYLAHKWGLDANLPVDHPYKSAAPVFFSISGTVTDENGNPCQRTVYAMSRPTDGSAPQVLAHGQSDPVTGEYELELPTGDEITRVVVAEDSGNPGPNDPVLPDLVDRVIPG